MAFTANVVGVGTAVNDGAGDPLRTAFIKINSNFSQLYSAAPDLIGIAISDEISPLTVGVGKIIFRMPYACTIVRIRASLTTPSSLGGPTINIKKAGVSIFSTLLTIDVNETTSTTAAVQSVISDNICADDVEMSVDVSLSGVGATGLKVYMTVLRAA